MATEKCATKKHQLRVRKKILEARESVFNIFPIRFQTVNIIINFTVKILLTTLWGIGKSLKEKSMRSK